MTIRHASYCVSPRGWHGHALLRVRALAERSTVTQHRVTVPPPKVTHYHASNEKGGLFLVAAGIVVALSSLAAGADLTDQVRKSRQDLTNASIGAVAPATKANTTELDRAIERLRNVRLRPKEEMPASPEPAPTPAPEKSVPVPPKPPKQDSPKPAATPAPASSDEFARLPPDRIANPLALADALYMGGRLAEAYIFYERTLKGDPARQGNAVASPAPEVKAWALFQMANCRRAADPEAAAALYRRVSIECTGSPWVGVAATQEKLIQWYQTMRPQTGNAAGGLTP